MGSLPDLTERCRPAAARPAARTVSDPHRNRTVIEAPAKTEYKKEWPWKKPKTPSKAAAAAAATTVVPARRRESATSSIGAASVRRLIARQPPRVPRPALRRFALLCVANGLCSTALLPFTALCGAEAGAMPLAAMHAAAAALAPLSPRVLRWSGARAAVTAAYSLVCALLVAHAAAAPLPALVLLHGVCGATLSPLSLALTTSATTLAQAAGDEGRRKVALRRALRGLRASRDLGLVLGSLMLGGALLVWPEEAPAPALMDVSNVTLPTVPKWPPPEEYFLDEEYEEQTCGAAGCPEAAAAGAGGAALSAAARLALGAAWATLAGAAAALAAYGAAATPCPPPDARSLYRDPRALLGAPMGLFIGLQQGFIYTSYVKWYGVCVGGWWCAWRALCGAGALGALAAGTLSMAGRGRGRALAAGGAAAHGALLLALLRWRAARTDLALPAVAAAAWGACAALWDVLQTGICVGGAGWRGAWSATLCARHAGLALACAARLALCVRTQLAALAAALLIALGAHQALEVALRRQQRPRT